VPDELVRASGWWGASRRSPSGWARMRAGVERGGTRAVLDGRRPGRCTRWRRWRSDPVGVSSRTDDRSAELSSTELVLRGRDGTAPQARIDDYRAKGYWNDDLIDALFASVFRSDPDTLASSTR